MGTNKEDKINVYFALASDIALVICLYFGFDDEAQSSLI